VVSAGEGPATLEAVEQPGELRVFEAAMVSGRHEAEVLRVIVGFIAVDVVDVLPSAERVAEQLAHDEAVEVMRPPPNLDLHVTAGVDAAGTIRPTAFALRVPGGWREVCRS
jgi:hypothetical protein